jgi:hypothetical protein
LCRRTSQKLAEHLLLDLIAESEPVLVRMGFKPLRALRAELAKTRRQA